MISSPSAYRAPAKGGHGKRVLFNTIANGIGQFIGPVMSLALVPLYIHVLGLELYGLIGFYSSLGLVLGIFSNGLTQALQREIAQESALSGSPLIIRRMVRSFEYVYGMIGLLLAVAMMLAAGPISRSWLQVEQVETDVVRSCLLLVGFRIALSFPFGVFQSVFVGLQRQVQLNAISTGWLIGGAIMSVVAVLTWRSVIALCLVDIVTTLGLLLTLRRASMRLLPAADEHQPRFAWDKCRSILRLSLGVMWTAGAGVFLTQIDRIILSFTLPLKSLAVYHAATAAGRLLNSAYAPFLTALYPETCRRASRYTKTELTQYILKATKVVLVLVLGFGLPLAAFAPDLLFAWTRSDDVRRLGAGVLSFAVAGHVFIGLAGILYQLHLAHGSTRHAGLANLAAIPLYPAMVWFFAGQHSLVGVSSVWLFYGLGVFLWLAAASFRRFIDASAVSDYTLLIMKSLLLSSLIALLLRVARDAWLPAPTGWGVASAAVCGATTAMITGLLCFGWRGARAELRTLVASRGRVTL